MKNDPINDITKRTQRYWYEDGIWEIGFGLVNLVLSGFYLIVASTEWKGPLALVLMLLQMGVIIGAFLLVNKVVKYLKERITYPRTGYVVYRKPPVKSRLRRGLVTALTALSIAVLISVIGVMRLAPNRMPLVVSVVMAGSLVYLGYRFGLLRFYGIAALVILLGYGVSLSSLSDTLSTAYYFGGFGLLMMLSGGITLLIYLRRTPLANDDYEPASDDEADPQARQG